MKTLLKLAFIPILLISLGYALSPLSLKAENSNPHRNGSATIVGIIIDASSGKPIANAQVIVKGTSISTQTDKEGHYYLRNLKSGATTLLFRAFGYLHKEKSVTLKNEETLEINFRLEEDNTNLNEVVVSANRQRTLRRLAPTLVSVLDSKTFDRANAQNLAQGLIFEPGVRVENNCQNCGFSQVRINGLDGRYSQILIDSRPVMSALGGVYGLEQIPTNMIDRVEVVRGGGSALYGSSAIAGVINVITKEPTENSFTFSESLGFTGMKKLDNNLNFNASIVSEDGRTGGMIFGTARHRSAYDHNGDGYSEIAKINSRALGSSVFFKPTNLSKLTAEIHAISEERRGGDHLNWVEHIAGVAESVRHTVYSGNLKYELLSKDYTHRLESYLSVQSIRRDSYYGGIGEPLVESGTFDTQGDPIYIKAGKVGYPIPHEKYGDNYGLSKGLTGVVGLQYTYSMDKLLFLPAQLLVGLEYSHDRLDDEMPIRHWSAANINGKKVSIFPDLHQRIDNFSEILQLEWKNDKYSILLGTRIDENTAIKKNGKISPILSPRFTFRYNPNSRWSLRATYARGFRAPQVFDEDLHVGVVGGEAQKVENDPDLKPEYSNSFSISSDSYFYLGNSSLNLLVEGFYTQITDVFTNQLEREEYGIKYYRRTNYGLDPNGEKISSGAKVYGINLEAKWAYNIFQVQGGLTLSKSMYDARQEWGTRARISSLGDDEAKYLGFEPKSDGSDFDLSTGDFEDISMTSKEYLRTPQVYGYLSMNIKPTEHLNLSIIGNYTGAMWVPHVVGWGQNAALSDRSAIEQGKRTLGFTSHNRSVAQWDELIKTKSFWDLGCKISYDVHLFRHSELELFLGVNNLFNSFQKDFDYGPDRDSAFIYGPTQPRTGYLGIKYTF